MTKALITLKRMYQFRSGHTVPVSVVIKYPVLLSRLLKRIETLKDRYKVEQRYKVFDLALGSHAAKQELGNQGGIYILHNKTTGLFYVESALRFFANKGRLGDYYMESRVRQSLKGNSTKVSYKLARLIKSYGMKDFTLVALPVSSPAPGTRSSIQEVNLKDVEQF